MRAAWAREAERPAGTLCADGRRIVEFLGRFSPGKADKRAEQAPQYPGRPSVLAGAVARGSAPGSADKFPGRQSKRRSGAAESSMTSEPAGLTQAVTLLDNGNEPPPSVPAHATRQPSPGVLPRDRGVA